MLSLLGLLGALCGFGDNAIVINPYDSQCVSDTCVVLPLPVFRETTMRLAERTTVARSKGTHCLGFSTSCTHRIGFCIYQDARSTANVVIKASRISEHLLKHSLGNKPPVVLAME